MSQNSIDQLRIWMKEQELDAFLVTQLQNRTYLSGWFNEDNEGSGVLVVGQQQQILLTHSLYLEAAKREAVGWQIGEAVRLQYPARLTALAQEYGWKTLGFESDALSFAFYDDLRRAGDGTFTLKPFLQSAINEMRQMKQPFEIELLKKAIAITDQTFAHICEWIQPGVTEKQVALEISNTMISLGAESTSFDTIVASGPNGSMPHAHPSDRQIQRGELITIDMGARYHGYCADMTRTICLGEPNEPRMREYYNIVLKAMKTCEAGLHAGITGRKADALAREVLDQAGLGQYYIHMTGHGVGLQIHEEPSLSYRAPDTMILPANSVVTIEPGLYLPGWSGLRIENCGLVTEQGLQVLTQSPTELVIQK
ncbi:MAG TPA: Xaa-Pro peptidase family protein [Ktedonobacteraceae bacterium]|nr:Xaa-Pro peptidase family protein [Ktedonobacteraceae bacterium]